MLNLTTGRSCLVSFSLDLLLAPQFIWWFYSPLVCNIQVVVGSFLSDSFKTQPRSKSPLSSGPGGSSGAGTAPGSAPGAQRPTPPRLEPKPSSASGPQQAPSVPSLPGQSSVPRPQAMSMFQPTFTWQFPPVSGEGRRTDINISLPGG